MVDKEAPEKPGADSRSLDKDALRSGTYEVIRKRLLENSDELKERLEQLNRARKEAFGSIETEVLTTAHITTEHNCVPRDIVAIGDRILFGYNVSFGLSSERSPRDVFALFSHSEHEFQAESLGLLEQGNFFEDFSEL